MPHGWIVIAWAVTLAVGAPVFSQVKAKSNPERDVALGIARRLDLTSFPNSTGPRRSASKHTLADYGFTTVKFVADAIQAREDGEWEITLDHIILPRDGDYWINLCFHDKALNGRHYDAEVPLILKPRPDGLYGASLDTGSGLPGCLSPVLPSVK